MEIKTTRFGTVEIEKSDVIQFSEGLIGLEHCQKWVLLADAQNASLGWLQCITHSEIALAVVSPRRFVPNYQVRVSRRELSPLELTEPKDAQVLAIVGKNDDAITLNLKAPLLMNVSECVGRQVINNSDQPLQHVLKSNAALRKSA